MKNEKKRFTREEILAMAAGVYRAERWKLHELARSTEKAAQHGDAVEYTRADEAYLLQQERMEAMVTMVAALGISEEELNAAAKDGKEV